MIKSSSKFIPVMTCAILLIACDSQNAEQSSMQKTVVKPGNTATAKSETATEMATGLTALIEEFKTGYYEFSPTTAVNNGLHQYDGRLPDYSADGIKKMIAWFRQMRGRTGTIDDTKLSDKQWLQLQQLQVVIDTRLFYLEQMKVMENNAWYGYSALSPDVYLTREYAPLEQRMRAFIKHAEAMTAAVPDIRNNLKPMASTYAEVMKDFLAGLGEFVSTTPRQVFAEVDDADLQAQMTTASSKTTTAFKQLAAWVEQQPRDENFALGKDRYTQMLWSLERIDTPIDELKSLAEQDMQRNLSALDSACAEYSAGTSISDCMAKTAADKFADGPVAGARRQLIQLRQAVLDKEIVSIPTDDVARVKEAPPHQRSNSAYMSMPGPYEKGMSAIYYIAPPDPGWSKAERLAYIPGRAVLRATSIHEVWPGHFLEGLHTNLSGNPVSELAYSYAFSEGWAHYVEEMMTEEALDHDAEMKIGQLSDALLRNVRFVSSLGLHTGGMTVEESEKLFEEKAFQDPANARQQAARGTFDPGYLFYTVGKLMIKKLRTDWMARNPDKTLKEFHDTLLSFGSAPMPLIRKMMLGRDDEGKLL